MELLTQRSSLVLLFCLVPAAMGADHGGSDSDGRGSEC